jgi:VanZ family protein
MLNRPESWDRWYRRMLPAYWVFLFCATHLPKPRIPGEIPKSDKLVHFIVFGVLAFLFWRYVQTYARSLSPHFVWIAFVTLGAYAAVDEYLQQYVNRATSLSDLLANLGGIIIVLTVLEVLRRRAATPVKPADGR